MLPRAQCKLDKSSYNRLLLTPYANDRRLQWKALWLLLTVILFQQTPDPPFG
jgi:hypothetical protein